MQFVELDVEFGDGMCGDGQGEGTTVAAEELVQTAADAVIIEGGELLGHESQGRGIAAAAQWAHAVEGFAGEQQVLEEDHQGLRRGDPRPAIFRGQIITEERF